MNRSFLLQLLLISMATLAGTIGVVYYFAGDTIQAPIAGSPPSDSWAKPDLSSLGDSPGERQIKYGRLLVVNTAFYIGPSGTVARRSNGMNCQNCHLEAGTKMYGNNYSMVAATYPKFRERSGTKETVCKRINDCIERSLNGKALDTGTAEMQAIKAYILWLGKEVPKGQKVKGAGITDMPCMGRAADPDLGKRVYEKQCQSCHQTDGGGQLNADAATYKYPPLWGGHSYNIGAGMYRLSRLAGYVRSNMPLGTTYQIPVLSEEEAWDVAAYVNSQPRPTYDLRHDWPRIAGKPVDHPLGPYADTFSERQHKYGPYTQMAKK